MVEIDPSQAWPAALGGAYAVKKVVGAVERVLGPSADEIGDSLRRYTAFRFHNVGRVAEKAEEKAIRHGTAGQVPPRVAHRLLEEGSYCDEEVMVEYLSGVLAASRTPGGRDDRAVSWAAMVAGMSTQQVRAHFLFYRAWAQLLHGRADVPISVNEGRTRSRLHISTVEFVSVMLTHQDPPELIDPMHCVTGLARLGLLEMEWAVGPPSATNGPYEHGLSVQLSVPGVELYGWALGVPGLNMAAFIELTEVLQTDPPYPQLQSAVAPGLTSPAEVAQDAGTAESVPAPPEPSGQQPPGGNSDSPTGN